ncbi:hypothetical protein GOP47_0012930 [Adiantum capillus-veneris]|uniref:TIR domain-containing protein n=1 Tax=Adiantum capillus-veneris TaxID=13818 RepID=A0A9D4US24_ADICA|nr:hypothetical protein GOP47_0012930 [Adiantum capillus-veneris]
MPVYMEAEFPGVPARTSSPSSSPLSSLVASSPPSSSQTSILIQTANVDTEDSSSLAPPFTTSPSSSAFSPSPLLNPSAPSARVVRFAKHVYSSPSSRADSIGTHLVATRIHARPIVTTTSPSTLTSSASSPVPSSPRVETWASSPQPTSPTSSAFVSASASPFISPPAYSSTGCSTPVGANSPPAEAQFIPHEETITFRPNPVPAVTYTPSFHHFSSSRLPTSQQLHFSSLNASRGTNLVDTSILPPRAFHATSDSPSSSARFRTCDVYIGIHGAGTSLARFSKWLRAELELQGIACFLADRAQYLEACSHDIALRTINSCTFGLVVITKDTFKNLYSLQEIHSFLHRKNLVPLFFDIAPSDCLGRDIVERRGAVWEKDGGELWRLYDGDEREWMEVLDGLSKVEEWKLEAHNGRWRDCILKAVSLLGTRLGRRSVAERERLRKEKVDSDEFPFPRNTRFVGRERELKHLESILFADDEGTDFLQAKGLKGCPGGECNVSRRRSDADRCQREYLHDRDTEGIGGRRKSDSERWHFNVGRDENGLLSSRNNSTSSSLRLMTEDDSCNTWNFYAASVCNRRRSFQKDEIRSNRHNQRTSRHRHAHLQKELLSTDVEASFRGAGGVVCVTGAAGIGKTEIVLEYAYRHFQRYRMVLWVGGEARYIRQNYLNLSLFLELDVGTESQVGAERGTVRTFDEQEMEAFQRIKRELQRDVPYLLVIDNVESECDWWDGRVISELIPTEGATHVILTTRLPRVMTVETINISYLSGLEALCLMQGKRQFISQELDALKEIEAKLKRSTFGLAIVGTLLSQLHMMPHELLEKLEKFVLCQWQWGAREELILENNPYLVKLLGLCFSFVDQIGSAKSLPLKMAIVGGWFGPFSLPLPLLAFAASTYPEKSRSSKLFNAACFSCYTAPQSKRGEAEAGSLLIKYGIARRCNRQGWICFHDIVQLYARKRGGVQAAKAMVQSIRRRGSVLLHAEQFWAACFLVLGFGNDPVIVELKVVELLSFIRKGVLPLALRSFTSFSRCHAALELLRLSVNALEDVEKLFDAKLHNRWDESLCCQKSGSTGKQVDDYVCQDVALLKALVLETRAKLMLKGGQFDAGEEMCRTCISIRTIMLGHNHPDTVSAQETLAKLVRSRSNA